MKNLKLYSGITAFMLLLNGYSLAKADGISFTFGDNGIENVAIMEDSIKELEPVYVYGNIISTVDNFSYYKLFFIDSNVYKYNIRETLQIMYRNYLLIEKYYSEEIINVSNKETKCYLDDINLFKNEIINIENYLNIYSDQELIQIFNGLYNGYLGYIDTFARVMTSCYHQELTPVVPGDAPRYIEDKFKESEFLLELINDDYRFDKKFIKNYTKACDLLINNYNKCKDKSNKEIIEYIRNSYNDLDNYFQEICNTLIIEEKVK